jgi:hypothetical protein
MDFRLSFATLLTVATTIPIGLKVDDLSIRRSAYMQLRQKLSSFLPCPIFAAALHHVRTILATSLNHPPDNAPPAPAQRYVRQVRLPSRLAGKTKAATNRIDFTFR